MAFDINQFTSSLQNDGTHSANKFDVSITAMPTLLASLSNVSDLLNIRCKDVKLPGVNLLSQDSYRYGMGPVMKQPYNAVFGDVPLNFLADRNGEIYQFWWSWLNSIYNFGDSNISGATTFNSSTQPTYTSNYEDDIICPEVDINTYTYAGTLINTVKLYRAKPVIMTGVPFGWNLTNQLVEVNVALNFREWSIYTPPQGQ